MTAEEKYVPRFTKDEARFFNCLTKCLDAHGICAPAELCLPATVGKVVEYDHVKRMMFNGSLRDDDNSEAGKKRHRDRVQATCKRAREAMMHIKVVGCHDPFIWLTGKAFDGLELRQ